MLSLINNAQSFSAKVALIANGDTYSYQQLLDASAQFGTLLLDGSLDLNEQRIGFVIDPGFEYVKVQWAIWRAGGIAVPLHPKAPIASHEYVMEDAGLSKLVCSPKYLEVLRPMVEKYDVPIISSVVSSDSSSKLPDIDIKRRAMILYTSGTTGQPKGVVTTHANIEAQIQTLVSAWQWSSDDHIINVLPLHHVHGIINVLGCALWSGARCEFVRFDEAQILNRLVAREVNLFMAVPTIYYKLINYWEGCESSEQQRISKGLHEMRLMVSGSAALPVSVLEKWQSISGHTLLERYGMTEIGMAVSNDYDGKRIPGHIGRPLPLVDVKLVDEHMNAVASGEQGEILVKGPNVFKEYWGRAKATSEAFTIGGWFRTGDIATEVNGYYKIIGRSSVDIIKSGGYKLSALEIEEVLRENEKISECGVVGLPNEEWGEIVGVGLVVSGDPFDVEEFKDWMKNKLSSYKIPRVIQVLDQLPRNAMGKVVKKELKQHLIETK
ncbi:MAG: acyl-CoA synthetase [Cyclobacteriaceae bacterium]